MLQLLRLAAIAATIAGSAGPCSITQQLLIPSISRTALSFWPSWLGTVGACSGTHPVGPGLGAMTEGFSAGAMGITLSSKPGWAIARSVRTFDSGLVSPGEVVLEEFPRPMGIG